MDFLHLISAFLFHLREDPLFPGWVKRKPNANEEPLEQLVDKFIDHTWLDVIGEKFGHLVLVFVVLTLDFTLCLEKRQNVIDYLLLVDVEIRLGI